VIQRPGLHRRAAVATVLALALPVLTGCGLEAKDETSKEVSQTQSAADQISGIRIRNAFITTSLGAAPKGADAYLVMTLINGGTTTDQLVGVSTSIGVASIPGGAISLPPGVVVPVSDSDIDPLAAAIPISGKAPTVGTSVPVQRSFATAGDTKQIAVPVVSPEGLSLSPTQSIPTDRATPPVEDAPKATD